MEAWRLITTWGAAPGFNMGLDEALLESGGPTPTLRFYTWSPDTLSLGYFQRRQDVPAAAQARAVVRRITGGGAIHHAGELTFSITAPLSHPIYRGGIGESYERVHTAIRRALAQFGVEAEFRGERGLASDRPETGMCFHHSTPLDLCWDDRKGVGSAQRRTRGRVLHHGSIKLQGSSLEPNVARVDRQGVELQASDFAPTLRRSLAVAFGLRFEPGVPDADERSRAKELGERYLDPAFVDRR